jgi:hypothetical protein
MIKNIALFGIFSTLILLSISGFPKISENFIAKFILFTFYLTFFINFNWKKLKKRSIPLILKDVLPAKAKGIYGFVG